VNKLADPSTNHTHLRTPHVSQPSIFAFVQLRSLSGFLIIRLYGWQAHICLLKYLCSLPFNLLNCNLIISIFIVQLQAHAQTPTHTREVQSIWSSFASHVTFIFLMTETGVSLCASLIRTGGPSL